MLTVARAKHLVSVEVGRGTVSLAARPGFEAGLARRRPLDCADTARSTCRRPPPSFDLPGAVDPARRRPRRARARVGTDADVPEGAGIGSLVLLALLAVPFIGDRLGAVAAPS